MTAPHAGPRAVSLVVTGQVQGVFFRDSCRTEVQRLGVAGWVRNERDGSVAVHAEGEPDAVDALVAWCHDGPPRAQVDGVQVDAAEPEGLDGFDVR